VLFGSDLLFNPGMELAKYRGIGLSDETLEQYLGANAIRVYGLPASVAS
jgi:predicted TIM-barrel fold metal-dependent hydrolase